MRGIINLITFEKKGKVLCILWCFKFLQEDLLYDMTPIRHLPVIFVNGVPGAGNQTVAQTITNITGYTMIRPGELVRDEAQKDTTRGRFIADKLQVQEDIPEVRVWSPFQIKI